MTGGLNPAAFRFGGSDGSLLQAILESLLAANGTAFTDEPESVVWARSMCDARTIHDVWQAAYRLRYATDPERMTEPFLSRWEAILRLPAAGLSDTQRRANVGAKMALRGQRPTIQAVRDLVASLLGPLLVSVNHTTAAATIGSIPGGLAIPGGVTLVDGPFSSHVCEIFINVVKPSSMSDGDFRARMNVLSPFLDNFLAAWTDWCWYADSLSAGTIGFFLDEPNLGIEGLSS